MWISTGDEVLLQAYTCVSVSNSIIQTGATPIYIDVDSTLNINPELIESKITDKTKVLIIQHTFGNPANLEKIQSICKKHNIILFEDCAQALGSEYDGQKVWTFGDLAIFSFWRDKIISTVNGGFLLLNNFKFQKQFSNIQSKLKEAPKKLIRKNINYMRTSYLSWKLYDFFNLGKFIAFYAKKFSFVPEILCSDEKCCRDTKFNYSYPNRIAFIAIRQIDFIDKYNQKRIDVAEKLSQIVSDNSSIKLVKTQNRSKNISLRFLLFVEDIQVRNKKFKAQKILLGDRYQQVIAPANTKLEDTIYIPWSCLKAEEFASQTINLPCHPHINDSDIKRIQKILNKLSNI